VVEESLNNTEAEAALEPEAADAKTNKISVIGLENANTSLLSPYICSRFFKKIGFIEYKTLIDRFLNFSYDASA